ncbi:uncharacterized protein LOC135462855 [Liolophura sinensis]|uniref:uncharacterized protein LOC135462855 n=1 Tax=Liolophura sinensis TaxID=3198878 RepID=UPI0031590E2C
MTLHASVLTLLSLTGVFSESLHTRDLVFGHVTQEELIISCEYNRYDWPEQVIIQWYRYSGYRGLEVKVVGNEDNTDGEMSGRASLGPGCSLVLAQPNVNDTGRYWVELRNYGNDGHAQKAKVTVVVTDGAQLEKCWADGCVEPDGSTLQNWIRPTKDSRGRIQAAIFTLCCLVLLYSFLGLCGASLLEWKVTKKIIEDTGEVTHSYSRYIPLLIGIVVFLLALSLTTSGILDDDVTLWMGIATGISNTVGAAVLLTHEVLYEDSRGFYEKIKTLQKQDDNFLDNTWSTSMKARGGNRNQRVQTLAFR